MSHAPTAGSDAATQEVTDKNLALAFEFMRAHLADDEVPDGATLVLLPDDDATQTAANIEIGLAAIRRGKNVHFRHVHPADEAADRET